MEFGKWYKYMIETADQEPPASAWEEIQNELDIDIVWKNLDKTLSAKRRRRLIVHFSAAASLIILLGLGTILYFGFSRQDPEKFIIQNSKSPLYVPESNETLHPSGSLLATVSDMPDLINPGRSVSLPATDRHTREQDIKWDELRPMPVPAYRHDTKNEYELRPVRQRITSHQIRTKQKPGSSPGYYAGLSGHMGTTWLLNDKTLQGLKSDDLTASLPSYGYSFGIIGGRSFGNSIDIQAEAYFINRTGQNYNEYLHGQYVSNSLKFTYSSITLSGRWYFATSRTPGRHSLLLGAYTGILRKAFQDINGESYSLRKEYNSSDFGVIAGYEYSYPLGNHLVLGTGFQTRFGLNNIFAGNEMIPNYLNNTRNASATLVLSLRYNLK
jgi:hypothetical protein